MRLLPSLVFSHKVMFYDFDREVNAEAAALERAWEKATWVHYHVFWKCSVFLREAMQPPVISYCKQTL